VVRKRLLNFKNIFNVVVVLLLIGVVIALIIINNEPTYNDNYFVSDGTKIVAQLDPIYYEGDGNTPTPVAAYIVYYYSGETIIDAKTFYKFETAEDARIVYDDATNKDIDWVDDKKVSKEYVIFSMNDSEYSELTTSIVRQLTE